MNNLLTNHFDLQVIFSQVLRLRVRVKQKVIGTNVYLTLFRPPELQPYYQIQFSVISKTLIVGPYLSTGDKVIVFLVLIGRASIIDKYFP